MLLLNRMTKAQEANEVVEWDDEAQDEADEAVESNFLERR